MTTAKNLWRIYRINSSLHCQCHLRISKRNYIRHSFHFPPETQPEDVDVPLKEAFNSRLLRQETKRFIGECVETVKANTFHADASHDDVKVQWKLDNAETLSKWLVTSDSDYKRGFSKCELLLSKQKTAIFRGYLDTAVPKDGLTAYSGMVGMRSERKSKAFFRKDVHSDWGYFTHLMLKVRGDGRTYVLVLHTPGNLEHQWHNMYSHPLYTHGGPYWQFVKVPFSKFYKAFHGRVVSQQEPLVPPYREVWSRYCPAVSLGIMLFDRTDGPFQLEIDWIGVYNDVTHTEEFAYEQYDPPLRF